MPQSWNRYAYTLNNPLNYVDPTGLYEYQAGTTDKEKESSKRLSEKLKDILVQSNRNKSTNRGQACDLRFSVTRGSCSRMT